MSLFNKDFAGDTEKMNDDTQNQLTLHQLNKHLKYLSKDKLWPQKYTALLENNLRTMVKDEVEQAIQRSPHFMSSPSPTQVESSECRPYKLQFQKKLPRKLFTENKVVAEDSTPVKIQLLDAFTEQPVIDGPLSSKKVEIVVVRGLSKAEQLEDWTKEEFCKHMLSARVNRKPLLVGQSVIALRNGIGCIDDVCITDNSSWVRSRMFRLGARIVGEEDQVMEAISTPFQVKDQRGEYDQKHTIPSPEDDVWRLYWIGKQGKIRRRLEEHQIYKVKDLVTQYYTDQSLLRRILSVSPKKWDAIIQQATSCFSGNVGTSLHEEQIQMSEFHGREHSQHQLNQPMVLDNSLLGDLLLQPCNDGHLTSLDYSMPSSSNTMLNVQASNWLPYQSIHQ